MGLFLLHSLNCAVTATTDEFRSVQAFIGRKSVLVYKDTESHYEIRDVVLDENTLMTHLRLKYIEEDSIGPCLIEGSEQDEFFVDVRDMGTPVPVDPKQPYWKLVR